MEIFKKKVHKQDGMAEVSDESGHLPKTLNYQKQFDFDFVIFFNQQYALPCILQDTAPLGPLPYSQSIKLKVKFAGHGYR